MTDHSDLIERLRACATARTGENPYQMLSQAVEALSSQSLSLSEAREEIERLKGLVAGIRECPQETSNVEAVAWDIQGSKKWCGEHVVTRDPAIRDQWADTPERYGITIVPLYARPAPSGWQDINTAPKDETVLIAVEPTEANRVYFGRRGLSTHAAYINPEGVVCDVECWRPDSGLDGEKWRAAYWMPLPQHPESSGRNHADAPSNPPLSDLSSLRKGAEELRRKLAGYAITEEYDFPGDAPEFCGFWCNECKEHVEADGSGHRDSCLCDGERPQTARAAALVSGSREDGADG